MTSDRAAVDAGTVWEPIASTLADAFQNDPVFSWLLPNEERRPSALERFFALEARHIALPHASSLVVNGASGIAAAALILPPERWRTPIGVEVRHAVDYARIFRGSLPRALGLISVLEREHLRSPHYYLAFVGVTSAERGRGHGGVLLEELGRRCAEEGVAAYLEASSPDNARLYRRHGFETLRIVQPFGSPPMELMQRPAPPVHVGGPTTA